METSTIIKLAFWLVFFIALLNLSYTLISVQSSIANVLGFLLLVSNIVISIKTKFFTIKNKKENEK